MRHVYLSPHLDDAVLSCGGAIHRHTTNCEQVLVITVFAGELAGPDLSPFALKQHEYWGNPPRPMALRRAEDVTALARLGTSFQHLEYLDAVYRSDPEGTWLYTREEALWDRISPADPLAGKGTQALADRLAGLLPPENQAAVHAPLGIGHHIDHQLVHAAGRQLLEMGWTVAFYEDYPYAERPGASEASAFATGGERWRIEAIPLGVEDVAAKVSALHYYRSQIFILFGGAETMPNRVWAFATSRSPQVCLAERIWWLEKV